MRVKDVLTPPTIACFLAVIVGFIVPVQKAIALRVRAPCRWHDVTCVQW